MGAWAGARLQRAKKVPELEKLLGRRDSGARKRLTREEREAEWRVLRKLG